MKLKIWSDTEPKEETLILRLVEDEGQIDLNVVDLEGHCLRSLMSFKNDGQVVRYSSCGGPGLTTGSAGRIKFTDE